MKIHTLPHIKRLSKAQCVEQARAWNHNAIFAASLGSVPATVSMMRDRRDLFLSLARKAA